MPILFKEGTQIEEMLKLYGIEIPCHVDFTGDSNVVMFRFENMPKGKVDEELIKEQ